MWSRISTKIRQVSPGWSLALFCVLLASVAFNGRLQAQERPIKVAVVDLDLIVSRSPAGRELQARLEKFQQQVRAEAEEKSQAARDIRNRMSQGAASLSEVELTQLQRQYEEAALAIRRFQDDRQREGEKMQEEGLRQIQKQLDPVFRKIRDEGGYDLILNNVPGVVVVAGPRVDITEKVLSTLETELSANQPDVN